MTEALLGILSRVAVVALRIARAGAVAAALLAGTQAAATEYDITLATGHPKVTLHIKWIDEFFIPEIDRRLAGTGHSVNWTRAYGGTVVKLGNEVHAVRDDIVQMTIVPTSLSAGKVPLLQVTVRTPFGPGDPWLVAEAVAQLHQRIPAINAMWDSYNIKYLDGGSTATYHLFSRRPIASVEQLDGMTIGVGGPVANWLRGTGAIPVTATLSDFYNDLRSGVYEAGLVSAPSAMAVRLHEVAPYIAEVNFGAVFSFALVINRDLWDRFTPEVQEIFQSVATEWRNRYSTAVREASDEAIRQMAAEGGTAVDLSGSFRNELAAKLPNIAQEWARYIDQRGGPGTEILTTYLDIVRELGGSFSRDWGAER